MTVKTQNRKTLNFTTIHKRISEQGKTISELAPEYSMTEEAFKLILMILMLKQKMQNF